MGLGQYALSSALFGNEFNWGDALLATGLGVLGGAFSGAGAKNAGALASSILNNAGSTAKGMVGGITNFTSNAAFSGTVSEQFNQALIKINIMTVVSAITTTLNKLYIIN